MEYRIPRLFFLGCIWLVLPARIYAGSLCGAPVLHYGDTTTSRQEAFDPETRELIAQLLDTARAQLSKPYAYGAKGPDAYDCSGFTRYVFLHVGIRLPASSALQAATGTPVERHQLRRGDLIFFKGPKKAASQIGHVGIVVGVSDEQILFIHSSTSRGIIIDDLLQSDYYSSRYVTARRVLE